jgi:hypothetical protein
VLFVLHLLILLSSLCALRSSSPPSSLFPLCSVFSPPDGYSSPMLTRARWFLYGSGVTLGITALVVTRARSMKERLDAEGVARVGASYAADTIEFAGRRLQRSAIKVTPDPDASDA